MIVSTETEDGRKEGGGGVDWRRRGEDLEFRLTFRGRHKKYSRI